ncbi:MAG: sigma-70 family RNA polymerase sigma factor [Planctomycetota bacterium]|nr:sigma-70 family RNA polymerase sigma factor [Planctomycetota bacterium]
MIGFTQTHITLLHRVAQHDDAAWAEFLARYGELIRGFCRRYGVQPADVDDVQQDVLLSLTKAMPGFEYDPARGRFRGYLKTVVVHACQRRLQQRTIQNPAPGALAESVTGPLEAHPAPRGDAEDNRWEAEWRQYHLRMAMRTIRAEFSETDVEAFDRYAVAGEGVEQVAADLGISRDAVYQAKSRISKRLMQVVEKQVEEEG